MPPLKGFPLAPLALPGLLEVSPTRVLPKWCEILAATENLTGHKSIHGLYKREHRQHRTFWKLDRLGPDFHAIGTRAADPARGTLSLWTT